MTFQEETKHIQTELSLAAFKANLCYASRIKSKAYEAHVAAMIAETQALTALNQAIVKKNNNA